LDRAVEFLPDDIEIAERRRRSQGLTRPELAVLLAYAKLALKHDLLASNVPDDPYLGRELGRYFPQAIAQKVPEARAHLRRRRETIVTQLPNPWINGGGPSLVVRIAARTGAAAPAIASAFAAVRESYQMIALHAAIDGLDNKIPGKLQLDLYAVVQDLLLDRLVWFLRNVDLTQGLDAIVRHYRDGITAVEAALGAALAPEAATARSAREAQLKAAGVPQELARRIASPPARAAPPDLVTAAD